MKYKIEFEIEKHHCMECPMCRLDDSCYFQQNGGGDGDGFFDTWEDQMTNCPLVESKEV